VPRRIDGDRIGGRLEGRAPAPGLVEQITRALGGEDLLDFGAEIEGAPAFAASSRAARPTQRYIAPVSRYVKPSRCATARATVDFPAPAGPSMAMTMPSTIDEAP
jgi:hypothetical protein